MNFRILFLLPFEQLQQYRLKLIHRENNNARRTKTHRFSTQQYETAVLECW